MRKRATVMKRGKKNSLKERKRERAKSAFPSPLIKSEAFLGGSAEPAFQT